MKYAKNIKTKRDSIEVEDQADSKLQKIEFMK